MSLQNTTDTEVEIDPKAEQQGASVVDTQDKDHVADVDQGAQVTAPEPDEPKAKVDPRQAKEQEIVDRVNESRRQEQEQSDTALSKPEPAAPVAEPAPADDDLVDLKVRKKPYRMTVKARDELLLDDYDDADIKEMSEKDKNRSAQMIMARDEYTKEIKDLKDQVNNAAKGDAQPVTQPVQQPDTVPVEPEKSRIELAQESYNQALEDFQFGTDGAKEALSTAQNELFDAKADAAMQQKLEDRDTSRRQQVFERDIQDGFSAADQILQEKSPQAISDPFVRESLPSYYDAGYRTLIAKAIDESSQQVQLAFSQVGITPDFVAKARGSQLMDLYQDMTFKGYKLPRPSAVMRSVAESVATRFSGDTKREAAEEHPTSAPTSEASTASIDRTDRKDALQKQPSRASLPQEQADAPDRPETQKERAARVVKEERTARKGRRK